MNLDIRKTQLLMLDRCWSMADLTRAAGLANTTLYKIIHGENNASTRTIGKIAKALDVKPSQIIKEDE